MLSVLVSSGHGQFVVVSVQVLAVHLENMQNVTFKYSERLEDIANNPAVKRTTLTEWLRSNQIHNGQRSMHLRYVHCVSKYIWDASGKCWIPRTLNRTPAIVLNSSTRSYSLCNFGLPMPRSEFNSVLNNRLLMEEKNYNTERLADEHELLKNALHIEQLAIYESVIQAVAQNKQILLFVYGHGGTRKTYLWTTIICALRSTGKVVLAVAASGIASLLLPSGRTAHSRFKIPLNLTDDSVYPVKPKASKSEVITSSLPRSHLWKNFTLRTLTENMRLYKPNLNESKKADIAWFSSWLLDIGDGKSGVPVTKDEPDTKKIEIPQRFLLPSVQESLQTLIQFIYDEEILANPTITRFSDKAIICSKNKTSDYINNIVLAMSQGPTHTYLSSDSILTHANSQVDREALYPVEYLNILSFNGLPPSHLDLKISAPIILLRK
ncbi:hypothetical protein L1987_00211 [Smallanthus sonchifolius]|uniref:Uncharacterized protein n=1 Tax=Smallanthus sonchifolius TaxID=185202 RepID=A0ACB9K1P9_9ASTR|nr:hypothetical protein L1987_00211 [Smallanthus sonchifolius]